MNFREANFSTAMLEWSSTLTMFLSFALSTFLFVVCLSYLCGRLDYGKPLVRHITAITCIDAMAALWSYLSSAIHFQSLIFRGDPPWCALFVKVQWWLVLVSALWFSSLALGVLYALLGWQKGVLNMRYSPIIILPLSLGMCAPMFGESAIYIRGRYTLPRCELEGSVRLMAGLELSLILVFVLGVLAFAQYKASKTFPWSVAGRSIRNISRYLAAYSLSHGLFTVSCLATSTAHLQERHPQWLDIISVRLIFLNGAFNFVALRMHVRHALRQPPPQPRVSFSSDLTDIHEVPMVDHQQLAWNCEEQTRHIEATKENNDSIWSDLGVDSPSSYVTADEAWIHPGGSPLRNMALAGL